MSYNNYIDVRFNTQLLVIVYDPIVGVNGLFFIMPSNVFVMLLFTRKLFKQANFYVKD